MKPLWTAASLLCVLATGALADEVEFFNGDRLQGTIVGVDANGIRFDSEALGELKISHQKIRAMTVGDETAKSKPVASQNENRPVRKAPTSQRQIPATVQTASPAAPASGPPTEAMQQMHSKMQQNLGKMMSGQMSAQELRGQALEARQLLESIKTQLGPQGSQLDGHLKKIDALLGETAP